MVDIEATLASHDERDHFMFGGFVEGAFDLTESEFEYLLRDLCTALGFCIRGPTSQRLWESKPATVDEFVEGLFVADGFLNGAQGSLRSTVKLHGQQFIAARRTP